MLYVNKFRKNGELQMRGVKMTVFYGTGCLLLAVDKKKKRDAKLCVSKMKIHTEYIFLIFHIFSFFRNHTPQFYLHNYSILFYTLLQMTVAHK